MLPGEGASDLIFAPTTRSLRFYRSYFRKQLSDVLFVGVNDPIDPEAIVALFSSEPSELGPIADSQFERYKLAQETCLQDLIGQLKQLKRDSVIKTGQDIQVVFSDVKEAPAHM